MRKPKKQNKPLNDLSRCLVTFIYPTRLGSEARWRAVSVFPEVV
jgi:hypothetical protein